MYAVFRETSYSPRISIIDSNEFQEFQRAHAGRPGYRGTIVVDAGEGRFLTMTLWDTAENMHAARKALGPVVERLLDPLMTSPSRLHGTGPVVLNDLATLSKPPAR